MSTITPTTQNYQDPLLKWPARGLAYSNEIGVAISEVFPRLGSALWVPAWMYFGADIYDKYKNDKTSHDPDLMRGTKQAIFQTLASVILPTVAVVFGQEAASYLSKYTKSGLTLNQKEKSISFIMDYMDKHKFYKEREDKGYKEKINESLDTFIKDKKGDFESMNVFKRFYKKITGRSEQTLVNADRQKLNEFMESEIDGIFKLRDDLLKGNDVNTKIKGAYREAQKDIGKSLDKEKWTNPNIAKEEAINYKAAKRAIKEFEKSRIFNQKMIKTFGGIVALVALAKPIDLFSEKIVIKKVVEPGLEKISK